MYTNEIPESDFCAGVPEADYKIGERSPLAAREGSSPGERPPPFGSLRPLAVAIAGDWQSPVCCMLMHSHIKWLWCTLLPNTCCRHVVW